MRTATLERETRETKIRLTLNLEGRGKGDIETGCGFLDHMLELFAAHGRFDITLRCEGDIRVDDHHTVEDVGIVLGQALGKALGEKRGITRYGSFTLPMDEVLMVCAVDLSGRSALRMQVDIPSEKVGTFDTELVKEFMLALSRQAEMNLHFVMLAGGNSHHVIEAMFKSLGRALRQAVSLDPNMGDQIPSTKGML
jgi:imidazoleglycerol-phosphate dehydratase